MKVAKCIGQVISVFFFSVALSNDVPFHLLFGWFLSPPSLIQTNEKTRHQSYVVLVRGEKVDALDLAAKGALTQRIYNVLAKPLIKPRLLKKVSYSIPEVAQLTGYSPHSLLGWIREGRISTYRVHDQGVWMIPSKEVDRLVNSCSIIPAARMLHVEATTLMKKAKAGLIEGAYQQKGRLWRISFKAVNLIHQHLKQTVPVRRALEALRENGIEIGHKSFVGLIRNLDPYFGQESVRKTFGQRNRLDTSLYYPYEYRIDLMDLSRLIKLLQRQAWYYQHWSSSSKVAKRVGRSAVHIRQLAGKGLIPSQQVCFNGRTLIVGGFTYRFSPRMMHEIAERFKTISYKKVVAQIRDAGLGFDPHLFGKWRRQLGISTTTLSGRRPAFFQYEVNLLIDLLTKERRFSSKEKLRKRDQLREALRRKYRDPEFLATQLQRITDLDAQDYRDLTLEDEQILIELVKLEVPQAIRKLEALYRRLVVGIAKRLYPKISFDEKVEFGTQGLLGAADRRLFFDIPFKYYAARCIAGVIKSGVSGDLPEQPGTIYFTELEESGTLDAFLYLEGLYSEVAEGTEEDFSKEVPPDPDQQIIAVSL